MSDNDHNQEEWRPPVGWGGPVSGQRMTGRPWTEADGIEAPPPWPATLCVCRHCGRLGSDPDGDHSCPCPHPDATCPDHRGEVAS